MIAKDIQTLSSMIADNFVLTHMTGMKQPRSAFLQSIANGTLNYFSAQHEHVSIHVEGQTATLTGQSRVQAAVFGGGRHGWNLQLRCRLVGMDGQWQLASAAASTY